MMGMMMMAMQMTMVMVVVVDCDDGGDYCDGDIMGLTRMGGWWMMRRRGVATGAPGDDYCDDVDDDVDDDSDGGAARMGGMGAEVL